MVGLGIVFRKGDRRFGESGALLMPVKSPSFSNDPPDASSGGREFSA
jgi:hypothetical protein